MLTPSQLENVADELVELYSELQNDIIADISRRVVSMQGVTASSVHQLAILQESGLVYRDAIREVAAVTKQSEEEVDKAFKKAGARSLEYDNTILRKAGLNAAGGLSPGMVQILDAAIARTNGKLKNLTLTTAQQSQQKFITATSRAYFQTASGGMSYDAAIRQSVRQLGREGITVVEYGTGYKSSVISAVRANVLTAINQTAATIQLENVNDLGVNHVEVSAHWNARPSHSLWQGLVYTLNGASDGYPNFYESTGYGTGEGLCGWNCRHSFYPFILGVSEPNYAPSTLMEYERRTVTYNGKEMPAYTGTQRQRRYEVAIRKTKGELAAIDAARQASKDAQLINGLNIDFMRASNQLKKQQERLTDFLDQTGLHRDRAREWTAGYTRSMAAKATRAATK